MSEADERVPIVHAANKSAAAASAFCGGWSRAATVGVATVVSPCFQCAESNS
jgi:hypothetical protein